MNSEDEYENTSDLQPDLEASNNEAVQRLLSLLDLSDGFTIAFVECNFWQDGVALVAALSEQIENDREWEDLQILDWEFTEQKLRLLQEMHGRLEVLPNRKGKKLVLVLRGLENAIGVVGDYPQFLADINFVRDGYIKMVPHPVVFVLPDYAITRFAKYAPDFWAWKSGLFKFKTAQETRDLAEAKTLGSDRILGSYIKPEKQERIDLLHRLLMEANPSGSAPESNRNDASQINILNELGAAYYSLSEYNRAIEFYQQALVIAKRIVGSGLQEQACCLNNLGSAYNSVGNYQQAVAFHNQALELNREIGNTSGEASVLGNLGNDYLLLGNYQKAIQCYQQSLLISREIGDLENNSYVLGNLGNVYYELGQYQESLQFYQQALEIQKETVDLYFKSAVIGNLGLVHFVLKEYQQAIQSYQQQLAICKEGGNRKGEANSLGNLGNIYHSLGNHKQAIQFYQQQLEICKEIGDRSGEGMALGNLGLAYDVLGQHQTAIEFQKQSLQISMEIGDRKGEAISSNNLAIVLKALGHDQEALEALKSSKQIFKELDLEYMIKKNLLQQILNWFRRFWSQLWRKY